ncbi:unnamed protein product [Closterium sp. NIES-64]|nr:unnamed protein product [Closterium sp. NIES-64]
MPFTVLRCPPPLNHRLLPCRLSFLVFSSPPPPSLQLMPPALPPPHTSLASLLPPLPSPSCAPPTPRTRVTASAGNKPRGPGAASLPFKSRLARLEAAQRQQQQHRAEAGSGHEAVHGAQAVQYARADAAEAHAPWDGMRDLHVTVTSVSFKGHVALCLCQQAQQRATSAPMSQLRCQAGTGYAGEGQGDSGGGGGGGSDHWGAAAAQDARGAGSAVSGAAAAAGAWRERRGAGDASVGGAGRDEHVARAAMLAADDDLLRKQAQPFLAVIPTSSTTLNSSAPFAATATGTAAASPAVGASLAPAIQPGTAITIRPPWYHLPLVLPPPWGPTHAVFATHAAAHTAQAAPVGGTQGAEVAPGGLAAGGGATPHKGLPVDMGVEVAAAWGNMGSDGGDDPSSPRADGGAAGKRAQAHRAAHYPHRGKAAPANLAWNAAVLALVLAAGCAAAVIVVLTWGDALFGSSEKQRHLTPLNAPRVADLPMFKGGYAEEMLWGTYRPQLYLGIRPRLPQSVVAGVMWWAPRQDDFVVRHTCELHDPVLHSYSWLRHDGRRYARQEVKDGPFDLSMAFLKSFNGSTGYGGDWAVRVAVDLNRERVGGAVNAQVNALHLLLLRGGRGGAPRCWRCPRPPRWPASCCTPPLPLGWAGERGASGSAGRGGAEGDEEWVRGGFEDEEEDEEEEEEEEAMGWGEGLRSVEGSGFKKGGAGRGQAEGPGATFEAVHTRHMHNLSDTVKAALIRHVRALIARPAAIICMCPHAPEHPELSFLRGLPLQQSLPLHRASLYNRASLLQQSPSLYNRASCSTSSHPPSTLAYFPTPSPLRQYQTTQQPTLGNKAQPGANVAIIQLTVWLPAVVDFVFLSGLPAASAAQSSSQQATRRLNLLSGPALALRMGEADAAVERRMEASFPVVPELAEKIPGVGNAVKAALSNLIGGIGYFHGRSRIAIPPHLKDPSDPAAYWQYWAAALFTATPSRPMFPRGFLWDEGFHQLVLRRWDERMAMDAGSKVPEEFIEQHVTNGNPPTLFLPLTEMADLAARSAATCHRLPNGSFVPKERGGEGSGAGGGEAEGCERVSFLHACLPRLKAWFRWFNSSQAGACGRAGGSLLLGRCEKQNACGKSWGDGT